MGFLPTRPVEILAGYDEDVSSIRDGFTAWGGSKLSTVAPLGECRKCLSSFLWVPVTEDTFHPGRAEPFTRTDTPRHPELEPWTSTRQGAVEKHIAGSRHVTAPPGGDRVSPARVPHESQRLCCLVYQRHLSLGHPCQVHLPPRHEAVKEGQLQAVISRASFRRIPRSGTSYFTIRSLHINNTCARKRGISENLLLAVCTVMHQQLVD